MRRGWLNLALLLATAVSVFFVFLWLWHGGVESEALDDQLWGTGFFTVSVLLILGSHEMGHWAMAKAHGVETSFPFFIPFPLGFGTLGAVIRLRGRVPNKNALVDIGAAGPLAGLAVALPLLVVGFMLSPVSPNPLPPDTFPSQMSLWSAAGALGDWARSVVDHTPPTEDTTLHGTLFGDNLVMLLAQRGLVGPVPHGFDVNAHPVLLAAWFGMLITMLNLMPAGQLDGGHLVHAWFGPKSVQIGHTVASALLVLALFFSYSWLIWFFLITRVFGFEHPPTTDEVQPLSVGRKITCITCWVLTVLVFMPVPLGLV